MLNIEKKSFLQTFLILNYKIADFKSMAKNIFLTSCHEFSNSPLLKEYLPRTQEKLEQDCLKHHCERSSKHCDLSSTQVSFLLTGEAGIVKSRVVVCIGF